VDSSEIPLSNVVQKTGVFGTIRLGLIIGLIIVLYRDAKNESQSGVERTVQGHCPEGDRRGDGVGREAPRLEGEVREHVGGHGSR